MIDNSQWQLRRLSIASCPRETSLSKAGGTSNGKCRVLGKVSGASSTDADCRSIGKSSGLGTDITAVIGTPLPLRGRREDHLANKPNANQKGRGFVILSPSSCRSRHARWHGQPCQQSARGQPTLHSKHCSEAKARAQVGESHDFNKNTFIQLCTASAILRCAYEMCGPIPGRDRS